MRRKLEDYDLDEVYDERLLDRHKSLGDRISGITYMQAAMTCFGIGAGLLLLCLFLAIRSGGNVSAGVGGAGLLSLLAAIAGLLITLYGHYIVQIEGKASWKLGLWSNLLLALVMFSVYLSGALL